MAVITTTSSTGAINAFCSFLNPPPINNQGQNFLATATGTITSLVVCLAFNNGGGIPTFDARISIYSDVAGEPGSELFVGHVAFAGVPNGSPSDQTVTWDSGNPTVTNGVTYWIRYWTDGNNFSATHYYLGGGEGSVVYGVAKQWDGSAWSSAQTWTNRAVITITEAGGATRDARNLTQLGVG